VRTRHTAHPSQTHTGVAKLSLVADDCQDNLKQLAPLSRPFNPASHLPWDCLKEMLVSVEGCKVRAVRRGRVRVGVRGDRSACRLAR
jgi:hypothetical protein